MIEFFIMIKQLLDNLITKDKLINILSLLNINVSWKLLQYSKLINSSKYYYKTIQKTSYMN